MDVLCTDKTGTLTEAQIKVVRADRRAARTATACSSWAISTASSRPASRARSTTAILERGQRDVGEWTQDGRGAVRLRAAAGVGAGRAGWRALLVVKGAPEDVLRLCDALPARVGHAGARAARRARPGAGAAHVRASSARRASRAGVAWREVAADQPRRVADEARTGFAGFVAFLDPPKDSAARGDRGVAGRRRGQDPHRRQRARHAPRLRASSASRSAACYRRRARRRSATRRCWRGCSGQPVLPGRSRSRRRASSGR